MFDIKFLFFSWLFFLVHAQNYCRYKPVFFQSINISGGSNLDPAEWSNSCQNSAEDLNSRLALPEYQNCFSFDKWGPWPNQYPSASIPENCDSRLWQEARILKTMDYVISKDYNYCHHHTPSWEALNNPFYRTLIVNGSNGVCKDRGKTYNLWVGIDCSSLTSFVYNFGLGAPINTGIQTQACGSTAPGKVLNLTNETVLDNVETLRPGDLLYIKSGDSSVDKISHVIMWIGKTVGSEEKFSVENLVKSYNLDDQDGVMKGVLYDLKKNKTLYVIADSSNTGPAYRIFRGWYIRSFSHARRLILPSQEMEDDCLI